MQQTQEMMAFDAVTKWYRYGRILLNRSSLMVGAHEKVLVCGENDSDLMALFRLASGVETPDEGHIVRDARTAFVPPVFPYIENATVLDMMKLPLLLSGSSRSEARKRAKVLLEASSLKGKQEVETQFLTSYEKYQLMLLMAFLMKPKLMVICYCGYYMTFEEEEKFWKEAGIYIEKTGCALLAFSNHHNVPLEFDAVYMISGEESVFVHL